MNDDSTKQEILTANDRFYAALAQASLSQMVELWHHSPATECVHPGWDRLRGWADIRDSWAVIFANQGPIQVHTSDPLVHYCGEMAWVTCTESVTDREDNMVQVSQMLATNVFQRIEGRWRMVVHHVSPAPPGLIRPRTWRLSVN